MRFLGLVVWILFGTSLAWAQANTDQAFDDSIESPGVSECIEDRDTFMALDYWTFDQDPEKGVRSVVDQEGCGLAAADLIRDFHQALRERGEPVIVDIPEGRFTISETGEVTSLYWHEGQVRAIEGQSDRAIELFRKTFKPEERNRGGWNEYALGTIAFIEKNLPELEHQRALMAERSDVAEINLGVLDGFIACFGQTYQKAYSSTECNRRPGFENAGE